MALLLDDYGYLGHRFTGRHRLWQLLLSLLVVSIASADTRIHTDKVQPILPTTSISKLDSPIFKASAQAERIFTLRHVFHHGTHRYPDLHKKTDIRGTKAQTLYVAAQDGSPGFQVPPLRVKTAMDKIERLVNRHPAIIDSMVANARRDGYVTALSPSAWALDNIRAPNVNDKDTVLSLAYMSSDAYVPNEEDTEWHDVLPPFNKSLDFGWEGDGLRGHVFSDESNSTVIIGLKGTSMAYFDGEGTTTNDKENDNLLFSCCCAQQGQWSYHQVCDCATDTYTCNNTCVRNALQEENRYYRAGRELYSNVTELYPNADIWLTGHSLGGAVSSLLGLTYGVPVVTFEAVPEALPASRLGLPIPPYADHAMPQARPFTGAYHFGHTADPVYIGTCSGATASCSYFGYAMESQCHTGFECVYDVVADKGWRVGIGTHRIHSVIHDVILQYDSVPPCKMTPECRDCNKWKMFWNNGTETTSTSPLSTSTKTRTRTTACETPGWWGCLDRTTSMTTTSPITATTTTSTSTCVTPGWFGCKDKTIIETTTTSASTAPTATLTCKTPGRFWGCYDKTKSSITTPISPITPTPSIITATNTSSTESTTRLPAPFKVCSHRNWAGLCKEWAPKNEPLEPINDARGSDEI